jgi:hypothetical protein
LKHAPALWRDGRRWLASYRFTHRYSPRHTRPEKTAISLPDPLYYAADARARALHISRSEV